MLLAALASASPGMRAAVAQSAARGSEQAAERAITEAEIVETIAVLADDSLEGRGAGTPGADGAARYIAGRFAEIGLAPAGGSYLQSFELPVVADLGSGNSLIFKPSRATGAAATRLKAPEDFHPLALSATGRAAGPLALAGADGAEPPTSRGAVVLLAPASGAEPADLRSRVELLEKEGATGVLLLSDLSVTESRQAGAGPVSIPVVALAHSAAERLATAAGIDLVALAHGAEATVETPVEVELVVDVVRRRLQTANVIGLLQGRDPTLRGEAVVIGAHYDHLGWGGPGSLAPGEHAIHNGADDNASGVAGVLELAEAFAADPPGRTLVFAAFGAEELGNLGSRHYVGSPAWPIERTAAMVNLDMVGRLRGKLTVYGTGTSPVWPSILDAVAAADGDAALATSRVPDGFGPSDHASFYGARVPVLAFFTGAHAEYHRPSDDVGTINAAGEVRVLRLVERVVRSLADSAAAVPYAAAPVTERRATAFKVALGTLPDYGFEGPGLRLSSVRPGGPADRAGLQGGDVILSLAGREIADVYAYTAVLAGLEAGRPVELVYLRDEKRHTIEITPEAR